MQKKIMEAGYRPVALLALFDANVLIRPGQAKGHPPGWSESPEDVLTCLLDGEVLGILAEALGVELHPLTLKSGRWLDPKDISPNFTLQKLRDQDELYPVDHLYAKVEAGRLELATFYSEGGLAFSSYSGRYDLHWADNPFMEGSSDDHE